MRKKEIARDQVIRSKSPILCVIRPSVSTTHSQFESKIGTPKSVKSEMYASKRGISEIENGWNSRGFHLDQGVQPVEISAEQNQKCRADNPVNSEDSVERNKIQNLSRTKKMLLDLDSLVSGIVSENYTTLSTQSVNQNAVYVPKEEIPNGLAPSMTQKETLSQSFNSKNESRNVDNFLDTKKAQTAEYFRDRVQLQDRISNMKKRIESLNTKEKTVLVSSRKKEIDHEIVKIDTEKQRSQRSHQPNDKQVVRNLAEHSFSQFEVPVKRAELGLRFKKPRRVTKTTLDQIKNLARLEESTQPENDQQIKFVDSRYDKPVRSLSDILRIEHQNKSKSPRRVVGKLQTVSRHREEVKKSSEGLKKSQQFKKLDQPKIAHESQPLRHSKSVQELNQEIVKDLLDQAKESLEKAKNQNENHSTIKVEETSNLNTKPRLSIQSNGKFSKLSARTLTPLGVPSSQTRIKQNEKSSVQALPKTPKHETVPKQKQDGKIETSLGISIRPRSPLVNLGQRKTSYVSSDFASQIFEDRTKSSGLTTARNFIQKNIKIAALKKVALVEQSKENTNGQSTLKNTQIINDNMRLKQSSQRRVQKPLKTTASPLGQIAAQKGENSKKTEKNKAIKFTRAFQSNNHAATSSKVARKSQKITQYESLKEGKNSASINSTKLKLGNEKHLQLQKPSPQVIKLNLSVSSNQDILDSLAEIAERSLGITQDGISSGYASLNESMNRPKLYQEARATALVGLNSSNGQSSSLRDQKQQEEINFIASLELELDSEKNTQVHEESFEIRNTKEFIEAKKTATSEVQESVLDPKVVNRCLEDAQDYQQDEEDLISLCQDKFRPNQLEEKIEKYPVVVAEQINTVKTPSEKNSENALGNAINLKRINPSKIYTNYRKKPSTKALIVSEDSKKFEEKDYAESLLNKTSNQSAQANPDENDFEDNLAEITVKSGGKIKQSDDQDYIVDLLCSDYKFDFEIEDQNITNSTLLQAFSQSIQQFQAFDLNQFLAPFPPEKSNFSGFQMGKIFPRMLHTERS